MPTPSPGAVPLGHFYIFRRRDSCPEGTLCSQIFTPAADRHNLLTCTDADKCLCSGETCACKNAEACASG